MDGVSLSEMPLLLKGRYEKFGALVVEGTVVRMLTHDTVVYVYSKIKRGSVWKERHGLWRSGNAGSGKIQHGGVSCLDDFPCLELRRGHVGRRAGAHGGVEFARCRDPTEACLSHDEGLTEGTQTLLHTLVSVRELRVC